MTEMIGGIRVSQGNFKNGFSGGGSPDGGNIDASRAFASGDWGNVGQLAAGIINAQEHENNGVVDHRRQRGEQQGSVDTTVDGMPEGEEPQPNEEVRY